MTVDSPPKEFFANVPFRPKETILGYLPGILSLVLPIQGSGMPRKDEIRYQLAEQATDLVGTDQRLIGYKIEEERVFPFPRKTEFRVRLAVPLEGIREVRVKDLRVEFLGDLTGMGLATVYLITGGSGEAQGVARWLETIVKQRLESMYSSGTLSTGDLPTGPRAGRAPSNTEEPGGPG